MQADEMMDFGTFIKFLEVCDIVPFIRNMYREQGDYAFMFMIQTRSFEYWFTNSFNFLKCAEGAEYWENLYLKYCPNVN